MRFSIPLEFEKAGGIYAISNSIDSRVYIGSAQSFSRRFTQHKNFLRSGKHGNPHLQNFANKHGLDIFTFELVELVFDSFLLVEREQHYLDTVFPFEQKGFNICKIAGSTLGRTLSPEAKQKISIKAKDSNRRPPSPRSIESLISSSKKKMRPVVIIYLPTNSVSHFESVTGAIKSGHCHRSVVKSLRTGYPFGDYSAVYKEDFESGNYSTDKKLREVSEETRNKLSASFSLRANDNKSKSLKITPVLMRKAVRCTPPDGEVKEFPSVRDAVNNGYAVASIYRSLHRGAPAGGLLWEYVSS